MGTSSWQTHFGGIADMRKLKMDVFTSKAQQKHGFIKKAAAFLSYDTEGYNALLL